ncbi:MAG: glycine zipper family protein [Gammaproteobacteria bacterium]|nr:glycine zipper family protein [Gammaproteobacteria bacterium]
MPTILDTPSHTTRFPATVRTAVAVVAVVMLAGCAGSEKRPVFYPNSHLEYVGIAAGQRDIDDCMARASAHGVAKNKDGQVGEKAAKGAVLGGIGSAAWGLVRGDAGERALAGAAAGAATGAAAGGFESAKLNLTYQRFVERCLQDRGYDVIGWE